MTTVPRSTCWACGARLPLDSLNRVLVLPEEARHVCDECQTDHRWPLASGRPLDDGPLAYATPSHPLLAGSLAILVILAVWIIAAGVL